MYVEYSTIEEWILLELGSPTVEVELSDEQIQLCISRALLTAMDHFTDKAYVTYQVPNSKIHVLPQFNFKVDLSDISFREITEVYRARPMLMQRLGPRFSPVARVSMGDPTDIVAKASIANSKRSNLEALLNSTWKVVGSTLYLAKYTPSITIEYLPRYTVDEDGFNMVDDPFWVSWIYRYSLALCKKVLGRVRGKFVVSSNPYESDAESLRNEGSTEEKDLLEEIKSKGLLDIRR